QAKCTQGTCTTFNLAGSVQPGSCQLTKTNWSVVAGFATISDTNSLTPTVTVCGVATNVTLRLAVQDSCACTNNFTPNDEGLTVKPVASWDITGGSSVYGGSKRNSYSAPSGAGLTFSWSFVSPAVAGVTFNGSTTNSTVKVDVASSVDPIGTPSFTLQVVV